MAGQNSELELAVVGCILGTAVGDALGLAAEGLSRARMNRLYPDMSRYHLVFGRGMVSDDAEHTCMTAQALIVSAGDVAVFQKCLGKQLRIWLLGAPAGIGLATVKAITRLWIGVPPERSGVWSAGNGPAMRAALLGVCCGGDPAKLRELVRASTRITHTDPKAEYGAYAVAWAAWKAASQAAPLPQEFLRELEAHLGPDAEEFTGLVREAVDSAERGETTVEFADSRGWSRGVGGYVYQTVPAVLHAWFRNPRDYRSAILAIVACGGDTDTTAAILGGILGGAVGEQGIPYRWRNGLWEWPRTVDWMRRLGKRLAAVALERTPARTLPVSPIGVLARNLFFACVVILHGFRRLLPPY